MKIVKIADRPDWLERAVRWFSSHWRVPEEAYRESMEASLAAAVPSWYLCLDGETIAAGMGVIPNDFHDRKDLTPNVCAVYTEEAYRRRGIAGKMLNFVCEDMADSGISTLYLLTDHIGFYERYGWEFLCMARNEGEDSFSRIYVKKTEMKKQENAAVLRGTLIAVTDMEKSKAFYRDVLGLTVENDFGANVQLSGGLYLQTLDSWQSFIGEKDVRFKNHAGELYFEVPDMNAFCEKLRGYAIEYVHPLLEHRWGQRVVRFYDPDCHVIEVAEEMTAVVRRFAEAGLTEEAIALRMDVPITYVRGCLQIGEETR